MAERAHPDNPGFRNRYRFHLKAGLIPWVSLRRSPYREAFYYRYAWAAKYCRRRDVLDIPCGMGWGTSLLTGCRKVVGVDIAVVAIKEARDRYGNRATFLVGDMSDIPARNNSFDVITCLEGIEHVSQERGERFLEQSVRVLRNDGLLLISSPHCRTGGHTGNPFHMREYKPDELKALIGQYYAIIDVKQRAVDNLVVSFFVAKRR